MIFQVGFSGITLGVAQIWINTDFGRCRRMKTESVKSTQSDWVVGSSFMEPAGGSEDLATKVLLPAGITNMACGGEDKLQDCL